MMEANGIFAKIKMLVDCNTGEINPYEDYNPRSRLCSVLLTAFVVTQVKNSLIFLR